MLSLKQHWSVFSAGHSRLIRQQPVRCRYQQKMKMSLENLRKSIFNVSAIIWKCNKMSCLPCYFQQTECQSWRRKLLICVSINISGRRDRKKKTKETHTQKWYIKRNKSYQFAKRHTFVLLEQQRFHFTVFSC